MDIKDFLALMWRGARFLAAGLILGIGLGLAASVLQPPDYEAATRVLVSRSQQQTGVEVLPLSEDQLVSTYALMVKTKPVLDDSSYELGVRIDPDKVAVTVLPNTLIIQIKVQDRDAKQAAAIANTLVKILIQENESLLASRYAATESALTAQIDQVQKQIESLQTQYTQMNDVSIQEQLKLVNQQTDVIKSNIAALEQDINNFPALLTVPEKAALAQKQAQLEQERSLLNLYQQIQVNLTFTGQPGQGGATREIPSLTNIQSNINLYQQIYLELQNSLEKNRSDRTQNSPNVLQIDPAVPPKQPVRPLPVLYVLLGGFVGFSLTAGALLLIDHVNNPLKHARQVEEALGLPVVGFVSETSRAKGELVTLQDPLSRQAEAYRALGAAVETARKDCPIGTLMVVNAAEGESKTAISANLAVVYAQQGRQVILLDGDIQHPRLHALFGCPNERGLANLSGNGQTRALPDVGQPVEAVEGLALVAAGVAANGSAQWMNAEKWGHVLSIPRNPDGIMIVESASPETANAQTLAPKVDGVLLVVRAEQTPAEAAQNTLRRFRSAGAIVIGAVLYRPAPARSLDVSVLSWRRSRTRRKEASSTDNTEMGEASSLPS